MEFKFPDQQEVQNAMSSIHGVQHEIQRHLDDAKAKLLIGDPSLACLALDVMTAHFKEVQEYARKALECLNRAQVVGEVISDPLNHLAALRQRIDSAKAEHAANLQRYQDELAEAKLFTEAEKSRLSAEVEAHKVRAAERAAELTESYAKELFMTWRDKLQQFILEQTASKAEVDQASEMLRYALRLLPKSHPVWQEIEAMQRTVE
jgi:hypothetical protein